MNSQICVHCCNKKPISSSNRLVTESCGHVKCMDCLLNEKSGCIACAKKSNATDSLTKVVKLESNHGALQTGVESASPDVSPVVSDFHKSEKTVVNEAKNDICKKKKPETSHISIESDSNGRCYLCTVCKKKFHARSQVAYHAYCNGQRKPYQCPECNKSFATHSHFKYHMRVHRNERTYACDVCGDSFFQMSKLQRHKLKHSEEKKYSCSECSKAFNNVTSLRKHALTHTEHRPHACAVCGRRFRDASNYRKHVAKHDEHSCACGVCGREVSSRGALAAHARAHHSRRPHVCPRCPQAFHSRKDMRRHAAVHTDSKPFRCKVCNRCFRRKDNLERHIRNTHPDCVPAAVVACDRPALEQLRGGACGSGEKSCLEGLNPLPPPPPDLMRRHVHADINENTTPHAQSPEVTPGSASADKSYILEANNARQSVIFGPVRIHPELERKSSPQEYEYVHKIRRANFATSNRDVTTSLPPIDERKIIELQSKTSLETLDDKAPPKNVELYKKILYERPEQEFSGEDGGGAAHEVHWRRKMKLNMNWYYTDRSQGARRTEIVNFNRNI